MRRIVVILSCLCILGLLSGDGLAREKKAPKVTIDEAQVYLGDSQNFKKPAVCDVDAIYGEIPEYEKIKDKGLKDSDPRYRMLMKKASAKFLAALEAVSKSDGFDLIGALGAIEIEGKTVPDITKKVIKAL